MDLASAERNPKPEAFSEVRIVDADSHISEWADLWTARAPARFRDRVPQIKLIDGKPRWVIDGDKSLGVSSAIAAVLKDGAKEGGMKFLERGLEEVHPGSYDVKARVAYLDSVGISAQIAYPNILGFGGQKAFLVDPELRAVSTEIFNDAMAEFQADSGDRIFPMTLLPWWDMERSIAEARRGRKMGLRGVNMNPDPHLQGLPDFSDPYWHPLWEVCCELDLPVNFHIGASDESIDWFGSGAWPSHSFEKKFAFASIMLFGGNMRVLANFILSGVLERFPTLKLVSVESGIGWVPFFLEGIEYLMREIGVPRATPAREIFRRQMYACCWFERDGLADTVRRVGAENVLFETDFPHPTCLYPGPLAQVAEAASELTLAERRSVFGGNTTRVYNLP